MIVVKLIRKVRDWQRDREAIEALLSRSDRDLSDVGLNRADVVQAVKGRIRSTAA